MFQPDEFNAPICSTNVLQIILNRGAMDLYDKYLNSKIPLYHSEDVINWLNGVLEQQSITVDKGETKYALLNKWNEEDEPKTKPIDNQAKYAVKMKLPKQPTLDDNDDAKSVRSNSSRLSKLSFSSKLIKATQRISIMNKFLGLSASNNRLSQMQSQTQLGIQQEEDQEEFKVVEMPDDTPEPEPDPLGDRLREEREHLQRDRFREQERLRKLREEQQTFEEKKKEQQRQLKHKQYTWDYNGEIIFLKQGRQAEVVTLLNNEIITMDFKQKDDHQLVKENNVVPDVKPVKESGMGGDHEKGKFEKAVALEFPKQPPLIELLQPKIGVDIQFDNGYLKEGGPFKKDEKMSKEEYEKFIENQPKPKPQYKFAQDDEVVEQKDLKENEEEDKGAQVYISVPKKINIENEEQYMMMMQPESVRNSSADSKKSKKTGYKSTVKSQIKLSAVKVPTKGRIERINAYNKANVLTQKESPKAEDGKNTRLHKVVDKFDRDIMNNPSWGFVEGGAKEKKPQATAYKLKHTDNFSSRSKATLFPPIKS